jgi:catechol 2,3-dioxygenase-like lactoylglutathione lyase family enzyme
MVFENTNITQIALIVRDIDAAGRAFAELFGVELPPVVVSPSPSGKMRFFPAGPGLTLELIEPGEDPSVWRDHLEKHGEGLHHIAFAVKGTDSVIERAEAFGMKLAQRGPYSGGGGEYAYLDATGPLKCFIETLENY